MVYTVTLNPALDYHLRVARFEAGIISRASQAELRCGGKGVNVSVVLTRLGVDTTALGFIAGETGEMLRRELTSAGVKNRFTVLDNGSTRINVKIESDKEYAVNAPGPIAGSGDLARLLAVIEEADPDDFVVVSGAPAARMEGGAFEKIAALCKIRGLRLVADLSGGSLKGVLPYHPFLVKPNLQELSDYAGRELRGGEEIERAAGRMIDAGALNVLISLGEEGARLISRDGASLFLPSVGGPARSTVGCGDSVVAGFIAGYVGTRDLRQAFRMGVACGCATAVRGSLADAETIEEMMRSLP